ncbi:MAG: hypothetical protein RJA51_1321, partial [Actinomycetota bacterium]
MTTNAHVTWLNMTDDDPAELAAFEAATGTRLHPVAREHLLDSREHELTPFPRIENHGDYLFGMLFVPSDTTNTKADFDRIVFAISFEHVAISVATHSTSTHDWNAVIPALGTRRAYSGDTAAGGRFLLELLDAVIARLSEDAVNLETMVHARTSELGSGIDLTQSVEPGETERLTTKARRRIMERYKEHGPTLAAVRHEMPAMRAVVSETSAVLGSSDPELIRQVRARADLLSAARHEGYGRALSLYDAVNRSQKATGGLRVLANVAGGLPLVKRMATIVPPSDTLQAVDLSLKVAAEMLAFTQVNGLPGDSFAAFSSSLKSACCRRAS